MKTKPPPTEGEKVLFTCWYCPNGECGHFSCQSATLKDIEKHLKECKELKPTEGEKWEIKIRNIVCLSDSLEEIQDEFIALLSTTRKEERERVVKEIRKIKGVYVFPDDIDDFLSLLSKEKGKV